MSTVDWRNKAIELAKKATDLDKEAETMEDPDKQVVPLRMLRGCYLLLLQEKRGLLMRVCTRASRHACMHACVGMHVCMHACLRACACMCVRTFVCMYVCMYVYM